MSASEEFPENQDDLLTIMLLLKERRVLLNNSRLPHLIKEKQKALEEMAALLGTSCKKLYKKIQNMKTRARKMHEMNKRGNRPSKSLLWMQQIKQLMDEGDDSKPVFHEVFGGISSSSDTHGPLSVTSHTPSLPLSSSVDHDQGNGRRISNQQLASSSYLRLRLKEEELGIDPAMTNSDLKRLLLLEQLQLTRMQARRLRVEETQLEEKIRTEVDRRYNELNGSK